MKMWRSLILIPAVTLLALSAGAPSAFARAPASGSSLTITALSPDTTTPYSGTQDTIYIDLSTNVPSGTVITTSSSDQSAMPVPASVTVTTGSTEGQVDFTAGNVTMATQATFTARLGSSTMQVTITVEPDPTPTLFSFGLYPSEVIGGASVRAEPDMSGPAPSGGVTVQLASSNPALAAVPSSATIPAGSYLANVTITTSAVTAVTDVTITATLPSGSLSSQLQIDPPETVTSVSLNPTVTSGTSGSSGEVTLGAPAPTSGFFVNLQSSDPSVASVPGSVEVTDGATGTGFAVTTSDVTTSTTVTITASTGTSSASVTLTVNPAPPPVPVLQSLTLSSGSVAGGSSVTGTATLTVAAPAGGAVVSLASSNSSAASVPASVTVPAGATSATFTVTTSSVRSAATVSIGGVYGGQERASLLGVTGGRGSVLPGPPSGYTIEPPYFDPTPVNSQQGIPAHPYLLSLIATTLPSSDVSLASGSLPPGFSLSSGTAGIQGVPTTPGLYAFVIKFSISGTTFGWPYVWQIFQPPPLVVSLASLPATGAVGQAYSGSLTVTGGVPPYTSFISAGSLPPGLAIDQTTGQITGTPTTAGTYSFTVQTFDTDEEATVDTPVTITISG